MFRACTRVMVLSSSFSGKTGPKAGSIGYISGDMMPISFDSDSRFFVQPQDIVFTRYGFSTKNRREHKKFISVLPAGPARMPKSEEDQEKVMETQLARTWNAENENCDTLNLLKSAYALRKTPVGVLVPAPTGDMLGLLQVERSAWLESQLRSEGFLCIVEDMLARVGKTNNGFDNNFLNNLFLMATSRDARENTISYMERHGTTPEFITSIQRLLSIGLHDNVERALKYLTEYFETSEISSDADERQFFSMLANIIFRREFDELSNLAIANSVAAYSSRIRFMKKLKSKLVSLARVLEDTKNPKSITVHP